VGRPLESKVVTYRRALLLSGITSSLGGRPVDVLSLHHGTVTSLIVPGQHVVLPGTSPGGQSTPGGSGHTVRAGDTLSGIAARYRVSLASLLAVNHLTVTSLIVPGQHLVLPGTSPGAQSTPGGSGHTVRAGDTLSGIAARYRVSLASLLAVNHLTVTSLIVPGMQLTLSRGADAPSAAAGDPIATVLNYARAQLGKPYKFYTAGPDTFDCSGLTKAAYARIGIALIHHSASQARQGTAVDFLHASIRPGDLVFMDTNGDGIINHVGMAITATTWIESAGPGDVVRITPMPPKSTIVAARRFVAPD
jgi:cell wall-associated NlpC family hydrolase